MIEPRCQRANWSAGIELAVFDSHQTGRVMVASKLTFVEHQEGAVLYEPTLHMRNEEAQMLMDELWRCGLRPTEGSGSAGSLAATERHLHDMQTIAMGLLRKGGMK